MTKIPFMAPEDIARSLVRGSCADDKCQIDGDCTCMNAIAAALRSYADAILDQAISIFDIERLPGMATAIVLSLKSDANRVERI